MHIFLIRHGIAEPRERGRKDSARALTPKGVARMEAITRGLERLGVRFDRLYHSPWKRAVQTADVLAPLVDGDRISTDRLAEPPSVELLDEIEGDRVALVGHEPWISDLLSLLVLGSIDAGASFAFKKGGVAWLEGGPERGACELCALLPPRVLRIAGGGEE